MIENVAREILVKSKRKVFSPNLGNNATAFVGNGLDFSELREYHFGDDVRKINWKATAKTGEPYLNLFTEERELTIMILLDVSMSCRYGTRNVLKSDLAAESCSVIAFSAIFTAVTALSAIVVVVIALIAGKVSVGLLPK